MALLKRRKEEEFSRYLAEGNTQTKAAEMAGYAASHAASQGCVLSKKPHIRARVEELREMGSKEIGKSIAVTKDWVIQGLVQNIVDAREDKQYAVVKGCFELIGKELRMFVDRHEVTELWDGDLSKLDERQLEAMSRYFWNFVAPEKRAELQRRTLEIEGPVIEAEFVSVPEEKPVSVEETGGWE